MDKLLKLSSTGSRSPPSRWAKFSGSRATSSTSSWKKLAADGVLLGWRPVINPDADESVVHAAIELRINPERDGGFDRLAQRVSRFDQVDSCYLMSGGYDLLIFVRAKSLRGVASFVYEKLATIGGVTSTATHFFLKTYKQQGFIIDREAADGDRLIYSP